MSKFIVLCSAVLVNQMVFAADLGCKSVIVGNVRFPIGACSGTVTDVPLVGVTGASTQYVCASDGQSVMANTYGTGDCSGDTTASITISDATTFDCASADCSIGTVVAYADPEATCAATTSYTRLSFGLGTCFETDDGSVEVNCASTNSKLSGTVYTSTDCSGSGTSEEYSGECTDGQYVTVTCSSDAFSIRYVAFSAAFALLFSVYSMF